MAHEFRKFSTVCRKMSIIIDQKITVEEFVNWVLSQKGTGEIKLFLIHSDATVDIFVRRYSSGIMPVNICNDYLIMLVQKVDLVLVNGKTNYKVILNEH